MAWICRRCETYNHSGSECEVCGRAHEVAPPIGKASRVAIPSPTRSLPRREAPPLETKPLGAPAKLTAESKSFGSLSIWQWRGLALVLILLLFAWQKTNKPSSEVKVQRPHSFQMPSATSTPIMRPSRIRVRKSSALQAEQAEQAEIQAQRARRIKQEAIDEILDVRKKAQDGLLTRREIENQQVKLRQSLTLALNCADKALRLRSVNRTAWQQKTAVLYLMGRYDDALQSAKQGLRLYPQDIDLLDARAKIQAKVRRDSPPSFRA